MQALKVLVVVCNPASMARAGDELTAFNYQLPGRAATAWPLRRNCIQSRLDRLTRPVLSLDSNLPFC